MIISLPRAGSAALPRPPREAPPARRPARLVGGFGICARNGTERTPPELLSAKFEAVPGPVQFKL
eukprot:5963265-Alexandrium_andersonii.AAC.1